MSLFQNSFRVASIRWHPLPRQHLLAISPIPCPTCPSAELENGDPPAILGISHQVPTMHKQWLGKIRLMFLDIIIKLHSKLKTVIPTSNLRNWINYSFYKVTSEILMLSFQRPWQFHFFFANCNIIWNNLWFTCVYSKLKMIVVKISLTFISCMFHYFESVKNHSIILIHKLRLPCKFYFYFWISGFGRICEFDLTNKFIVKFCPISMQSIFESENGTLYGSRHMNAKFWHFMSERWLWSGQVLYFCEKKTSDLKFYASISNSFNWSGIQIFFRAFLLNFTLEVILWTKNWVKS